jgi:plastocyanin
MKRFVLVAGVFVALVALFGCSSASDEATTAGNQVNGSQEPPFELNADPVNTNEVTAIKSYMFEPEVVQVKAGSDVTWTNEDDFPHNVHFLDGSDGTYDLPIGDSTRVSFDEVGEFYYECSIHPQTMHGKVIVTR